MHRRIFLVSALAVLISAAGVHAQEPLGRDTVEVLPPEHPLRPQPPPRPDLSPIERIGSVFGKLFRLPFEYVGTALEGTLIPIEEERGGFAAGLAGSAARAREPSHFSITGGSLGTRSGFVGAGIKYRAFTDDTGPQLGFTASATNRGYQDHTVFVGWNDPRDHPYLRLTGYYDLDSMDEYWGLGPDTEADDKASFSWEKYGGMATVGTPAGRILSGQAYVTYETTSVFRGREVGEPDVVDRFPEDLFPELELWGPGATVALALLDAPGYPKKGILLEGTAELWRSAGDEDLEWLHYAAAASGHIPLGSDWYIVSLKAGFDVADPEEGEIPFPYLPALGGSQNLRGFGSWRWRDQATLYGTAEFRWRIWLEHTQDPPRAGALETAIFYDIGNVGEDLGDIDLGSDRKTSYGLVARFYVLGGHLMTLGAGRSDEETRFIFTTNNIW